MRRSDREIRDLDEIEDVLKDNTLCHLAMVDGSRPYMVTVNYGYRDGFLYFHSALSGRKIDVLHQNPELFFQIVDTAEFVAAKAACGHTTRYRSVTGEGRALFVDDVTEKVRAMNIIMAQHTGKGQWSLPSKAMEKVTIVKVKIESMVGKRSY